MFAEIEIESNAFSWSGSSKTLIETINKALRVSSFSHSPDDEKYHFLLSHDHRLFVVGYSTETFIILQVPNVQTTENGILGFQPQMLLGTIKNRGDLTFMFARNKLSFKAQKGKYQASLNTLEVNQDQIPHIQRMMRAKTKSRTSVSGAMLEEIRKGVKYTDLRDHYNEDQILCAIRLRNGLLEISAHDNFHMSYFKSRTEFSDSFQLAVPVATFKLIDKFITDAKEDAELYLDKQFRIIGSTYMIALPPIQVDDEYFDRVPGYINSLKTPLAQLYFSGEAIKTVDNMFTLADDETRLSMDIQHSGEVSISLSTDSGKIRDGFTSKKIKIDSDDSVSFMVDPRIFADLFTKAKDMSDIPMRLYSKRNKGVSSCFMISASADTYKAYLVGTYYEE